MKKEEQVIRKIVDGPGMSLNGYQNSVVDNVCKEWMAASFTNGILGLGSEIGKCFDFYKKWLSPDNSEFDHANMAMTLGEISRYLAITACAIGYDLEDIFRISLERLNGCCFDGDI